MKQVVIIDVHGDIVRVLIAPDEATVALNLGVGERVITTLPTSADARWVDGGWVARSLRPSVHHRWVPADAQWVDPRDAAQRDADLERRVKTERDRRLAGSDWRVLSDAPGTLQEQTAWTVYRQALRNVPLQPGFPANITWPTAPGSAG